MSDPETTPASLVRYMELKRKGYHLKMSSDEEEAQRWPYGQDCLPKRLFEEAGTGQWQSLTEGTNGDTDFE